MISLKGTVRGASMVEYAPKRRVNALPKEAGAFKILGPKVGVAATRAGTQL